MHRLTQAAYRGQEALDPPSGATRETVESVRAELAAAGAAIAWQGETAVGCVRFEVSGDHLHVRRLAVEPARQGRGFGRSLMVWVEAEALRLGRAEVTLGVRLALPGNVALYRHLGYDTVAEHAHAGYDRPTWVEMRKRLPPAS